MAGSRRETVGTLLTRIRGLLKSGALKYEERPLWYDIVTAKPPKPVPEAKPVPKMLYPEDFVRVHFYQTYSDPHPETLGEGTRQSGPQRFIDKYLELQESQPKDVSSNLFEEAAAQVRKEGVRLMTHEERKAARFPRLPRDQSDLMPRSTTISQANRKDMDNLIDSMFDQDQHK